MKDGIHPDYRDVVFLDMASGFKFITRSTINTRESIKMDDGKEYPLFKLDVTSESHPFYTGPSSASSRPAGWRSSVRNLPAAAPSPPDLQAGSRLLGGARGVIAWLPPPLS